MSFGTHRVTGCLRKRHPGITWKRLFRRFLAARPGHRPAEGKEVLFLAQQVPIVRYR
jgi:RNA-directed DNA polymerase